MKGDQKKVTDEGPQKPIMLKFVPVPLRPQDPLRPVRQVVQKQILWHLPLYFRVSTRLTVVAGKKIFIGKDYSHSTNKIRANRVTP